MPTRIVYTGKGTLLELICISLLCLLVLPLPSLAQNPPVATVHAKAKERSNISQADPMEDERRAFAISLVISTADEARSYPDLALRPRVLARSADVLWNADNTTARALFRRAWEAAEKGDAEQVTIKTKDNPPPMVIALRRASGQDLRYEVMSLAARRDRALSEEFFGKLTKETERETEDAKSGRTKDSWSTSEAASKRLQVAHKLLDEGQVERAMEFAAPALDQVSVYSIGFLSALRAKNSEAADQNFALLLARTQFDPSSDANTVSGLSSYAFTPGFYVTFNADGGSRWTPRDSVNFNPPNLAPALVKRFFEVGGAILLRPLPPPDQDFTSSGRTGKRMVMLRLLPLFDQYAPDTAAALRAQLMALGGDPRTADNPLLTDGLLPEETGSKALERMQNLADRAKTSGERDAIYADAAVSLASQGDIRATDVSDKIEENALRADVRRFVDFEFVRISIRKKEPTEAARLAKSGQLTHSQRAWAYTEAARLLMNSDRPRSLQLLEEATLEARRIDGNMPDRAVLLIGVATQFLVPDRIRAWEMMDEAVKAANSTETFTGDNEQIPYFMGTNRFVKFINFGGKDYSVSKAFRLLTADDFHRSIDLAKSFKNSGPRASAILAISSAVLEK
jgi:hypothetical protein